VVRRLFDRAWIFGDRDQGADDSAEHLYRWIRKNHPSINAWFLLDNASPDWSRLREEGFRLVPQGLVRRLLILNAEHVVSSHTDLTFGGLRRDLYASALRFKSTFLQHGVIKDDLSHWLGPCEFDCFVTSSPAEHESIVGDDTPYPYTEREVKRTGLPRHDRLLRYKRETPEEDVDLLLVMPTWRAGLVDERSPGVSQAERTCAFAKSEYATRWRSFLRSDWLQGELERRGMKLAFMPHFNAQQYIEAFDVPGTVTVVIPSSQSIQPVLARSRGLVTDFTSVAFDIALLRRAVFYYQFDREKFFGGDHNWRPGYFDYDRDGFGPVALDAGGLEASLRAYFERGCSVEPKYLERMQRAMPDQDERACERTFQAILATRGRWRGDAQSAIHEGDHRCGNLR